MHYLELCKLLKMLILVNMTFGVKAIYDMHRYLMTKHNISP